MHLRTFLINPLSIGTPTKSPKMHLKEEGSSPCGMISPEHATEAKFLPHYMQNS
jgi:hypothetical protein